MHVMTKGKEIEKEVNAMYIPIVPDLDQVVASSSDEPSLLARSWVGADQATGKSCGGPADGVHAHPVSMESLVGPVVVAELKNARMTVGRSAGKETAALMRSPGYHVDRSGVKGEIEDLSPCASTSGGGGILRLLSPNQNLSIVRRGGQNCAELGVCLSVERS